MQLQAKTHGNIIAWSKQVSLAQIRRHFQHTAIIILYISCVHLVRVHHFSTSEYTLRSLLFAGTNFSELGMQRIWQVLILAF